MNGIEATGFVPRRVMVADDGSAQVVLAAHDLDRAQRALAPVYGDRMRVGPSRWSPDAFAAIKLGADIAERQSVLFSIGASSSESGYERHTLGLRLITADVAVALEPVPDPLLSVHALLTRAGITRPPQLADL
jgi:hypothetical protein